MRSGAASVPRQWGRERRLHLLWWVSAAAIFLFQCSLILTHQPFVDEWQALQLAVQSPTLADLLGNLRYEGHPPLWHLFLRAIAALVGPLHALQAATLLTAGVTQFAILFRSPFPRWARVAIALNEPVLFDFGVISRGYSLGMAILFIAMLAWKDRRLVWLPIALLPTVEFFFGLFSIALIAARLSERRIWWPGVFAWLICSLFAAATVPPADDFVSVYNRSAGDPWALLTWLFSLSSVVLPWQWNGGPNWNAPVPMGGFAVLWIAFFYLVWEQTRGRLVDRLGIGLFLLATLAYVSFLYGLAIRHLLLVSLLIIALEWRHALRGEPMRSAFRLWIIVGAVCGIAAGLVNAMIPFDSSARALGYIRRHNLEDAPWVSAPAPHGQGISAISGIMFEGPENRCRSDFMRWNFQRNTGGTESLTRWVERERERGRFLLLSAYPLEPGAGRLLTRIPAGYNGGEYYIYEISARGRGDRPRAPLCVENARPLVPNHPRR